MGGLTSVRLLWIGCVGLIVWVLCLIFLGALVTSWNAGMAVPDWPLSFGSLNPEGWWRNFSVRLEHGHRLVAVGVGLAVGVFVAYLWGNWRALALAAVISGLGSLLGRFFEVERAVAVHLGIWPAACAFIVSLLWGDLNRARAGHLERRLGLLAFALVCVQASLGGLRVTRESAGMVDFAIFLRILHGCTAQVFLVCLVALMALLGGSFGGRLEGNAARSQGSYPSCGVGIVWVSWVAVGMIYGQLILGAVMRHLGAGLAISSFPLTGPEGGLWPESHGLGVDLNFAHTRVWAFFCSVVVIGLCGWIISQRCLPKTLWWGSVWVLLLLGVQVWLGMSLIWRMRPPLLASFHVLVGALLLGSMTWVAVKIWCVQRGRAQLGGEG